MKSPMGKITQFLGLPFYTSVPSLRGCFKWGYPGTINLVIGQDALNFAAFMGSSNQAGFNDLSKTLSLVMSLQDEAGESGWQTDHNLIAAASDVWLCIGYLGRDDQLSPGHYRRHSSCRRP